MAIAAVPVLLMAQGNANIKGTILDNNGNPMGYANVVMMTLPDSTFVQGAISDSEGKFMMTHSKNGALLKISSIGYETAYVNLPVNDPNGLMVTLREDSQMLGEVTVKGQLPKTKLTGNSMITSIQGTVLEKSGTAKEMLAKVPGMMQKGEDLEVLGKGSPVIYINGRKINDRDELKRLRSEEIKEVEVITNPGAQYDATVTSVVRIKTIRLQGNGLGYDLDISNNSSLRYGYQDPSSTLNLRYRHNGLDVFGMANYWKWDSPNYNELTNNSYILENGQMHTMSQYSKMRSDYHGEGFNYNFGFNFQPNEKHSLGMRMEFHDPVLGKTDNDGYSLMNHTWQGSTRRLIEESFTAQHLASHNPYNWEGNAYYNGTVGKLNIDLNLDFLTSKNNTNNKIQEIRSQEETRAAQSETLQSTTNSGSRNELYAGKLVLSYPVWKGQLQAGSEMTFAKRNSYYMTEGLPLPSTDTKVNENNIAFFAAYSCTIPSVGNLQAGVRYEHVGFDYTNRLDAQQNMTRYTNDIFPNVSWSKQFGQVQAAVSYGIRTVRPDYSILNETMHYINPYTLKQGDSKLKNNIKQELSISGRWKFLNMISVYERNKNMLSEWSYIYNDEGVILIKEINMKDPVSLWNTFINATPTFGCYSPYWSVGVSRSYYKETLADPREANGKREIKSGKPVGFINLTNTFRLPHSWQLEGNAYIQTRGDQLNFHLASTSTILNFTVQKSWLKNDALTLRASIDDVLQKADTDVELDCGYYNVHQHSVRGSHRLAVSLHYTFNAAQSKYKGTGAGKDAAARMGN